ncbi:MAG: glycoside hydrolase family 88 protein [Bacteroidales bacterium]|nr:glycoside hydrolase family 88 protein [Bacteroidales bacterium]
MKKLSLYVVLSLVCISGAFARSKKNQPKNLIDEPKQMAIAFAEDEMKRFPELWMYDWGTRPFFGYSQGVGGNAYLYLYAETGDRRYFDYAEQWCDTLVNEDGTIKKRAMEAYNLDLIRGGMVLCQVYRDIKANPELVGGKEAAKPKLAKYKAAMKEQLIRQLRNQPKTCDGGFWHKLVYPHQMWLDGIYMASPFMAAYGDTFKDDSWKAEALQQVITCWRHTYDPKTGLLHHAWDESAAQRWSDAEGHSPNFWGRSIGWYLMAMVDILDYIPEGFQSQFNQGHKDTVMISGRDTLIRYINTLVDALPQYQRGGMWYQVMDQPDREGNWPEATVTTQFMYGICKAINKGYLPADRVQIAIDAYNGLQQTPFKHRDEPLDGPMLIRDSIGRLTLSQCCAVGGLGGKPYRDGSFNYYINERIRHDDGKGTGPFIVACYELGKIVENVNPAKQSKKKK